MNIKLIEEAAKRGDVQKLQNLIKDDSSLLWSAAIFSGQTPLHISCISGHVDFVKEVLSLRPEFAMELNQDGLSPLHIASAKGDTEIVEEILKLGCHLCLVKGKDNIIPLHLAVVRGRAHVIRELVSACLDSITEVTARGENCFHLAVKNNQFEAFKVLVQNVAMHEKEATLNNKDGRGNTVLHLAALTKQYQVVDLLLDANSSYKDKLEANALNKGGLSPLDVLLSEGGDSEIEEIFHLAGAVRVQELHPRPQHGAISPLNSMDTSHDSSQNQPRQEPGNNLKPSKKLQDYFKFDKINDSRSEVRNTLLIVAALIATSTYQAVLNPPGEVEATLATKNVVSYCLFLVFNSIGYYMSIQMIYFLTTSLPLQFELRVSLFGLTGTYITCMVSITPFGLISFFFIALAILLPLIFPILTKAVRDYWWGPRTASWNSTNTTP